MLLANIGRRGKDEKKNDGSGKGWGVLDETLHVYGYTDRSYEYVHTGVTDGSQNRTKPRRTSSEGLWHNL